jgi:hypothetical protein
MNYFETILPYLAATIIFVSMMIPIVALTIQLKRERNNIIKLVKSRKLRERELEDRFLSGRNNFSR